MSSIEGCATQEEFSASGLVGKTFCVTKYKVSFMNEVATRWELTFSPSELKTNKELSPSEARMVIDKFDLVLSYKDENGEVYDTADGKFRNRFLDFFKKRYENKKKCYCG